ncbi:Alpha/beta knot methyltransferase [Kickxella alabastrina]|uniref:Alpha/beta knot methyltransferase n=1 Tax=Kickxella alabastrina TaxID=61397 RepID=UPI00221F0FEA|nr:Alpha/beta knot methyltransferase [Kickxella alabastrina]KAI7825528.1 Alpha/beta knot methyltransferase [Kickxella alabastrina]
MPNVELIYGLAPIQAALRQGRREAYGLFIQAEFQGDMPRPRFEEVISLAESMEIPIKKVSSRAMSEVLNNSVHQGVILKTDIYGQQTFDNGQHEVVLKSGNVVYQPRRKFPLWLCLDGIQDTHNLGSIIRSALYFGIDGLLLGGEEYCRPTPTVSKTSSGAMECMNIHRIFKMDKTDGWSIICTTTRTTAVARNISIDELPELDSPTIVVLGSEQSGISGPILDLSDINVHIPERADTPEYIDSLNVGVATGVVLSALKMPKA